MKDKIIVSMGGNREVTDASAACYYIHTALEEIERRTGRDVVIHIGDRLGFDESAANYFCEFYVVKQAVVTPALFGVNGKRCKNADRLSEHRWCYARGSIERALAFQSLAVFRDGHYAFTVRQDSRGGEERPVSIHERVCQQNSIPLKSIVLNTNGRIREVMTTVTSRNQNNSVLNLWHQAGFQFQN
jgi:hypothetical protein